MKPTVGGRGQLRARNRHKGRASIILFIKLEREDKAIWFARASLHIVKMHLEDCGFCQ